VEPQLPSEDTSGTSNLTTDWIKCIICQEKTTEALRCPAVNSKSNTLGAGYNTLADILQRFDSISSLPKSLSLSRLNEGTGIEATLINHEAKWHDSCRLKYNKTKLERALRKRKAVNDEEFPGVPKKFTRKSIDQAPSTTTNVFLL